MKVYKRNFMRPHTDAPWFTPSDKFKTWIKTNYEDTGKCTKFREMSYDDSSELTMTLESHWDDSSASDMTNILASSEWQESLEEEKQHNTDWGIILISQGFDS